MLHLKAKADRLFNRDRLIFDPLEPRVLLDGTAAYEITKSFDPLVAEHKVLVELIETNLTATSDADKIQQVQVFAYTNGTKGARLHTFGDVSKTTNSAFTITGTSEKDHIVVDVASFERLTGSTTPTLLINDPANDGGPIDNGDTIELLNRANEEDSAGATFTFGGKNTGSIKAGKFEGNFAGIGNLVGAAGADDTLVAGSSTGILTGAFSGGKRSLQIEFSAVTANVDATLTQSGTTPNTYLLQRSTEAESTAATFAPIAFTAPSTKLGVLLGSGNDTLRLATLPPGPSFTVSGGAGADSIVFDTALRADTGNLGLTFDGGDGDDKINLNKNLEALAGSLAVTFHGGAGDNSLTVAKAAQIKARDGVAFTLGAVVTPDLPVTGSDPTVKSAAKMGVVVSQDAVIGGSSVAITVNSSTTVTRGETSIGTARLSVEADTAATIRLAGRIETAGEAALVTNVTNSATLTSTLASQLHRVSAKQKNTSTIDVGATDAINGGTVKLAADTQANVTIKAIGLVLSGLEKVKNDATLTAESLTAIVKGEQDLGEVLGAAASKDGKSIEDLFASGFMKKSKTAIENETRVTLDGGAQVRQIGTGTVAGSDAAVLLKATDDTKARTMLVATDGVSVPVIGRMLDNVPGVLNPFALWAEQDVKRVTRVDLGSAFEKPAAAAAKIIDAAGAVTLQAGNSGTVIARIRAATLSVDDVKKPTKTSAGDGGEGWDGEETDNSLPAPIKTGYANNTVDDTVRVELRGVSVAAAALRAAAANVTTVEARAIQAQNTLKGSTVALTTLSRLSIGGGALSITAIDAASAMAIAEPVDTDTLQDTTDATKDGKAQEDQAKAEKAAREFLGIGRGSAINLAERDVTARLVDSETTAADVTLVAQNSLELVAEAQATGVASILGAAGSIAVNIVLGSTDATITGGNVKATTGDVVVNAADTSTIDARARTTVDTASRDGQLGITVPSLGAAAAFNIVGYALNGMGSSGIIPKILSASIDTVLGTGLLTAAATQTIRARIEGATVEAGGRVQVTATSAGLINSTVSNTIANKTPEQTLLQDIAAEGKRVAINQVKSVLRKPASAATQNSVAKAGTASFGGIISTNRVARAASAEIVALKVGTDTTLAKVTGTGALEVLATDRATINANVKLVASSQAASDGGLDPNLMRTPSDNRAGNGALDAIRQGASNTFSSIKQRVKQVDTKPDPANKTVTLKLGKRILLDFPEALNSAPIAARTLNAVPLGLGDALNSRLPATAPKMQVVAKDGVVLVGPGHPSGKGEVNTYYRYKPLTASAPLDLNKVDFTDTTTWQKIGQRGAVYEWMGPDHKVPDNIERELKKENYSDRDFWRRVGDGETQPGKTTGSGATAMGGIVSRNDIRGGATAIIAGSTAIRAGSVAITAERNAVITARTDATVEAVATIREQQGSKADGQPGAGTASPIPGQTSLFDRGKAEGTQTSASNALAVNAVISTNVILSTATARIDGSTITTTTDGDGAVSVNATTGGAITSSVDAQVTALSSGPATSGDESPTVGTAVPPTTTARAAGVQLAFNAIGFDLNNLAFATLDALIGVSLGQGAPQQAVAEITKSSVTATGAVRVTAESSGVIDATLGNKVTAAARAASANALAVSGIVATNRVSGAARATIDLTGSSVSGTDVTVSATDSVKIASTTTVGASASAVSTGSIGGVDKSAETLLGDYKYTTASGKRLVKFGEKIRLSDTWAGKGEKGAVYQYMGEDFELVADLSDPLSKDQRLDFSNFAYWKKLDATNVTSSPVGPQSLKGKIAAKLRPEPGGTSSLGLGGLIARNDVSGKAEASIVNGQLTARGDVSVTAKSTGAIKALDVSVISGGKAGNGVLVTNAVLNGATAFIESTTLTGGAVTVTATNASDIDASARGKTAGDGSVALGFTLAFNTIGFKPQNVLFDAVDAIVGDPLIATATGAEQSAGATAFITGTSKGLTARRDVTVAADSRAQIKAVAGSEVAQADSDSTVHKAQTGAQGISAGAVLASNKVSARAEAYIGGPEETDTYPANTTVPDRSKVISTGGSVFVTATNLAGIDASSTIISSSAVSGSVAQLASKAASIARNIYDYTTKSGTKTIKAGDRVRTEAKFTVKTDSSTDPIRGEEPNLDGRVFIFVGAASRSMNLADQDYTNAANWFALDDGAVVSKSSSPAGTASTPSGTTGTQPSASSGAADDLETKTVTTPEGTVTITRMKVPAARYSSKDGYQDMMVGQGVMLSRNDNLSKGDKGTIYIWRGADNTRVTLHGEDYTSDNWIPAPAKTVMPALDKVSDVKTPAKTTPGTAPGTSTVTPPTTTRTPASSSKSIGGLIVFNEVNGGATARITRADVTANADITVSAKDAANIAAEIVSTVTASGGASFTSKPATGSTGTAPGDGNVIAVNGLAATNVVRGGATASVLNAKVEATRGDLAVRAENTAGVDARLRASSTTSGGGQGGVSAAVTLAFNSVGYETQNLLFNTVDALIGSPTISDAFGKETSSGATATIVRSTATAGGDIAVTAVSTTKINSTVSNAAQSSTDSMKGSGGTGFGVVLASNKVSGRATARIDNTPDFVNRGTPGDITAGDAVIVSATDAASIASNAQLVTSSTVVKTDGGTLTNQAKLNKFLPSDFSTNPNEVQSATIQSNLIKNRADLLPAEINRLEAEMWAEVARVKQLVLDLQARPNQIAQQLESAQLMLKSRPEASDYLTSVYTTLVDAMDAAAKNVPADNRTDLKKNLTDAALKLRNETKGIVLNNSAADAARDTAYKYAAEAAFLGLIDDAALRASTEEAKRTVGEMIGRQVSIMRANREAVAQIEELRDKLNAYLAPFGLSTDVIGILDLTAFGQVKKTANPQDVTFGARVRIAQDYADGANKAPSKTTDGKEISVKTGDTVWDNGNNSVPGGAVYKYVGETTLLKQQPSKIKFDSQTNGKPDWVKISSKPSVYAANEIYIYMGEAAKLDLAAQDYSDKTLWKRALDSNFIPDGFVIPGTTATPTQPSPAATDPATPLPVGDPSANNPQPTAMPQNAAALAIGGLVVVNSVHGGAAATIAAATVKTGTGAVTVTAQETATITATADSAATVKSADSYKKTAPASTGTGTPPATGTPAAGTQTQTKSVALGGIIATNSVLGSADAKIVDSTVTTKAGGVSVTASNTATIDATNKTSSTSDLAAVALTLAFNTVGWKDQNVLFRAADTITGQPLIGEAFQNEAAPAGASAQILNTDVTTTGTGAVLVEATANAGINAVVSNKSSASGNALKDANAVALGFVLTGNMVNTRALATIDSASGKSIDAGGALTIRADSAGSITSANRLSAIASLTKPSVLEDFAEKILANYDYTKKSGEKNLKFGDLVYNKENGDDKVYVYIGESAKIQLADAVFTDGTKWRLNNAREFLKFLPPGVLNLADSKDASPSSTKPAEGATSASDTAAAKPYAVAVSGILVSNDVRSTAEASLKNMTVTRAGDVTVAARQTGTIEASVTSKVESKLKPGTKPGEKEPSPSAR
ncbi:hypothetical protein GCM10025880_54200 [Methylorubrum aminovorans]|nr:hypothetical protein GCM10025880_54200 [Methylorubrum aminovorans]